MTVLTDMVARRGFDPARLTFFLRTAVAACIAIYVAWVIGLEHPQWAAMAVWASSQPTRGQLLEKSFFRFAGTVLGSIAGVVLVLAMKIHPALLVIGLASWVGACTFVGNVQRGLIAYGAVLAGYTAAMVSLLDTAHPDHVLHLGLDRMATALTGVIIATLVGYLFARRLDSEALHKRVQNLVADIMRRAAKRADAHSSDHDHALLADIAHQEEGLDPHAAGSVRAHRMVHATRGLLIAAVPLLIRKQNIAELEPALSKALTDAADHLSEGRITEASGFVTRAISLAPQSTALYGNLIQLNQALRAWRQEINREPLAEQEADIIAPLVHARDWLDAREAMMRATLCLLGLGLIWLATGWALASYTLLGLSVMISLFSTMENPAYLMKHVFAGQFIGAGAALICRWLVWPHATSELQMVLMMMPFILIGALVVSHQRTALAGIDYNMVMLLLLQPHFPMQENFSASLLTSLAVIAAPLFALVAFTLIFPPTSRRKLANLFTALLHEVKDLAGDPGAMTRRHVWQARIYHRTMRLVRLSERAGDMQLPALDAGLAFLNLGRATMRLHELQERPDTTASTRRAINAVLKRLGAIEQQHGKVWSGLDTLARRSTPADAALLQDGADAIAVLTPYLAQRQTVS